ncbi:TRAP transporter large permease [Tissierella sp. Yu-01]|uniref:TRAP transporter large permease n=1 Tax=Tissierella sp. Yu-01 TaxID=3035694 RepID=UPI00240D8E2E|nr:TRAP transporter large permease [Tissierella sp. Yu-01]WFA08579.1 TRAP transporter large permease [Tissierella sp. Yu-01]
MTLFIIDIVLLVLLLMIGVPLPFVFGGGLILMVLFGDINVVGLMIWGFNQMLSPVLLASPFFMLAGTLIAESGIAKKLMDLANLFIGKARSGLGVISILTCGILGAISGSCFTGVAAVGPIMIPEMERRGYERGFASALVTCSSVLGALIPPSIPIIIYGWVTGTSVLGSFLSTVVPGIMVIITFSIINYFYVKKLPTETENSFKDYESDGTEIALKKSSVVRVFVNAIPGILIPVIILGGIYGGIFTPTEAAAVAAALALLVGVFIYKELRLKNTYGIFKTSSVSIGAIMVMMMLCLMLSQTFVMLRIPQQLVEIIMGMTSNKLVILILINIFLAFMGMIVNDSTAIILTAPLLLPLIIELGMSPIQFAAIMTINLAAGSLTPPYASVLYYGMKIGDVKFNEIIGPAMKILLVGYVPVLLLTTFIEPISMFLPTLFGY